MSRLEDRRCAWCGGPINQAARRDALTCSKACRQAKSRFRVGPATADATKPMRFAYADPPYPGMAQKYYGTPEVDHRALVDLLVSNYPDGWALSTDSTALQEVLGICPAGVRVACWVKGPRQSSTSYLPRKAWEPLIVSGGRARRFTCEEYSCDVLLWGGRQSSHPGALVGMKPAAFAEWMFQQLDALRGDQLDDLFPGSGAISRAWGLYTRPEASSDGSRTRGSSDTKCQQVLGDGSSPGGSCLAGAERRLGALLAPGDEITE